MDFTSTDRSRTFNQESKRNQPTSWNFTGGELDILTIESIYRPSQVSVVLTKGFLE
jgi:hypothetical protein